MMRPSSFDQVLESEFFNFEAWNGKGMALGDKGDLLRITGLSYRLATSIDPLNPPSWNNEGVVLRALGRYQEALVRFDKALLLDPNNEEAQNNRNYTLQDMNKIVQLGGSQGASIAL